MKDWQEQLVLTAKNTLQKLHHEHEAFLAQQKEESLEEFAEVLQAEDWDTRADILEQYEYLARQTTLFSYEEWQQTFDEKRKDLLANVAIIPADFREKLRSYLESKQENFKVGGLFSAKRKTAEERERRIEEANAAYQAIVQSQIIGHIKALMKEALRNVGALNEERATAIDQHSFALPFSIIEEQVQLRCTCDRRCFIELCQPCGRSYKTIFHPHNGCMA